MHKADKELMSKVAHAKKKACKSMTWDLNTVWMCATTNGGVKDIIVRYHGNMVFNAQVKYGHNNKITHWQLNTCGWLTKSTARKMNACLLGMKIPFSVKARKHFLEVKDLESGKTVNIADSEVATHFMLKRKLKATTC